MLVRALEACFIDGHRRRKDAEFDYAGEKLPPHLVPVKKVAKEEPKAPEPEALSELAKAEGKPKSFTETFPAKVKK